MIGSRIKIYSSGPVGSEFSECVSDDDCECGVVGRFYLPDDYVRSDVEAGRLVRMLETWCPPFPGYHLYYPSKRQHSPAFTVLLEALRYRSP